MRTIKFRIWHKIFKEMFYPEGPTKNEDYEEKVYLQLNGVLMGDFRGIGIVNCSDDYVIQQFTGLLDKNGKEIYEGDILLCRGYDDCTDEEGYHYTLTVEWKQRDNGDIAESYGYLYIPKDRKIIGNIFENENTKV